ncbi:YopX protein [compost metagenome]
MRDMKCKAYYKPLKIMLEPEQIESINFETKVLGVYIVMDGRGYHKLRMSDFEIMWYTGRKDKNDKEIFGGSTVLITGEQELDFGLFFQWNDKAIVRWNEEECGFYLDVINKREVSLCQDGYFTVDTFPLRKWDEEEWSIEYEVIDNPDLLGG